MEKKYILFDLDGTLINSYEGIVNGYNYAFEKAGISFRPDSYQKFIGPSLEYCFRNFCSASEELTSLLIRYYREYYIARGIHELCAYDGVSEMLKTLHAHEKKLMIATAKPEFMAEAIAENLGFAPYLCYISGVTGECASEASDGARIEKKDVIDHILKVNDIKDIEHAVMIGDKASDIQAARELGLDSIGVLYGFGTREELVSAGPAYLASSPREITEYILNI